MNIKEGGGVLMKEKQAAYTLQPQSTTFARQLNLLPVTALNLLWAN